MWTVYCVFNEEEALSDWVRAYYADVDAMRLESFLDRHSADAHVVFGNNPPAVGRDAIAEAVGGLFAQLSALRHELRNLWIVDGGASAVVEALVHYTTGGGFTVAVPAVSLLDRDSAGAVASLRVHIDMAPLFTQLAAEASATAEPLASGGGR